MELQHTLPLHVSRFHKLRAILNRAYSLLHSLPLSFILYYRLSFLLWKTNTNIPLLPWLILSLAELFLSFIWLLQQAFLWNPNTRTAFPERLVKDEERLLPGLDVFVCTADPSKEPTVDVMNTVISAMALDYPADKLHVYVSDDGGSSVTLKGMKEAWLFAKIWLPFCRKYGIKTRCPAAYFDKEEETQDVGGSEFILHRQKAKENYNAFKECVLTTVKSVKLEDIRSIARDHPPLVQVINDADEDHTDDAHMPLLVYVAREKKSSQPHHFKAGALNVLLRVSSVISNSKFILVLDCDMYCNDPTSAKQAMCFLLDPSLSSTLAFVQFPQKFHNVGPDDIYDSRLRTAFEVLWYGMDGLEGPSLCGTGFFLKREAIYGTGKEGPQSMLGGASIIDVKEMRECFGNSNEFIKSLQLNEKQNTVSRKEQHVFLREAHLLASCSYEDQTKWGAEVGFLYVSVVEDLFSGFRLHCTGWTSVYCNPGRPSFLGATTTTLNDLLVQGSRWSAGLMEVALSKYCPLFYRPSKISIQERMCYSWMAIFPLCFLSVLPYAIIPQLCLLHGIPLYPRASSPLLLAFLFVFLSSQTRHLYEVLTTGGSMKSWCSEQRIWMIKALTSHFYGSLDAFMKVLGLRQTSFIPTNKVVDGEQEKLYRMGIYDFQTLNVYLVPFVAATILNLVSFVGGMARVMRRGNWDDMCAQLLLSSFILFMSSPVMEAIIVRRDSGRIPWSATLISLVFSCVVLVLGSFILL